MTKSTVVDNETGKSVDSTVRTSTGTFYGRGEDEVRVLTSWSHTAASQSIIRWLR